MPIHLRAEPGDYAAHVLCPGDPRRATHIAENFLDPGARQVNAERGLLGYTGTFRGEPISVQTTGMGCPSAGIVVEELIMLGATRLIRVGTCGGLGDDMSMGDTVIALSATADDSTPLRYTQMEGFAATATFSLVETAVQRARDSGARFHVGPIVTSGLFYDSDPTTFGHWKHLGHLGVEMEAAMIYAIGSVKRIETLAVMTVSDLLGESGESVRISDEELRRGVDAMMHLACEVAIS